MFIRKIAQVSAFTGTVAISLLASAASSQALMPVKGEVKYVPMESIHYDFGSKSMSGYFVDQAASCVVTLMVYEKGDPGRGPSNHGDPRSACAQSGADGWRRQRRRAIPQLHLRRGSDGAGRRQQRKREACRASKTELAKGRQPIVEDLTFRARRWGRCGAALGDVARTCPAHVRERRMVPGGPRCRGRSGEARRTKKAAR